MVVVEIIICSRCKGKGVVEKSELLSPHNGIYDYWSEMCPVCQGTGRMQLETTTVTKTVPFDTPEASKRYRA